MELSRPDARTLVLRPEDGYLLSALDASYPHFGMRIEPNDTMHFHAESAKRQGVLRGVPHVVHIETPKALRADERVRSRYAWVLAACVDDLSAELPR